MSYLQRLISPELQHVHLIYAMPGLGKTTALKRVRSVLDAAGWGDHRDLIEMVDSDDLCVRDPSHLVDVVSVIAKDGWTSRLVLVTNQWRTCRELLERGALLSAALTWAPSKDAVDALASVFSGRNQHVSRDTLTSWVFSAGLENFRRYLAKRWYNTPSKLSFGAESFDQIEWTSALITSALCEEVQSAVSDLGRPLSKTESEAAQLISKTKASFDPRAYDAMLLTKRWTELASSDCVSRTSKEWDDLLKGGE